MSQFITNLPVERTKITHRYLLYSVFDGSFSSVKRIQATRGKHAGERIYHEIGSKLDDHTLQQWILPQSRILVLVHGFYTRRGTQSRLDAYSAVMQQYSIQGCYDVVIGVLYDFPAIPSSTMLGRPKDDPDPLPTWHLLPAQHLSSLLLNVLCVRLQPCYVDVDAHDVGCLVALHALSETSRTVSIRNLVLKGAACEDHIMEHARGRYPRKQIAAQCVVVLHSQHDPSLWKRWHPPSPLYVHLLGTECTFDGCGALGCEGATKETVNVVHVNCELCVARSSCSSSISSTSHVVNTHSMYRHARAWLDQMDAFL
jgi:hypothetical protein